MTSLSTPLRAHPYFKLSRFDELIHTVGRFGAQVVAAPTPKSLNAIANNCRLRTSEVWFCSYESPLSLRFQDGDYLRVQLQHRGTGTTRIGAETFGVNGREACISPAQATIEFGAKFEQIVWRVGETTLARKLWSLTGNSPGPRVAFHPQFRLDSARAAPLMSIFQTMLSLLDAEDMQHTSLVLAELEQALMVALLMTAQHDFRAQLESCPARAGGSVVKRAEEFLAARFDSPFDSEALALHCGTSVRSIYRAFKRVRNQTPMQFLKQQRLLHAERLLRAEDCTLSVTEIAFACGFSDLSQFSRDFARMFGEPPSRVSKRTLLR